MFFPARSFTARGSARKGNAGGAPRAAPEGKLRGWDAARSVVDSELRNTRCFSRGANGTTNL